MHSIFLIKPDLGISANSKTLKFNDEDTSIKQLLLEFINPERKVVVEAQLGIEQFERYSEDKSFISHLFYSEKLAEHQKKLKAEYKSNLWKRLLLRLGINIFGRHCYYYFIFDSKEEINKYVPVSVPTYLDSYFICIAENAENLKQKISSGISDTELLSLCYAYIPNQGCMAGPMSMYIYSNVMAESDFKVFTETILDSPKFQHLSDEQIKNALKVLC